MKLARPNDRWNLGRCDPFRGSCARWTGLIAGGVGVMVIWCVLLPRMSQHPSMQRRQMHLERLGVEANVTFYTDLPCMDQILRQLERPDRPKCLDGEFSSD